MSYETEEQQWNAIKQWFNKYGSILSWAVIAVCAVVLMSRYYFHHQDVVLEQGSEHYFAMVSSQEQNDTTSMLNKANRLIADFPETAYAQLAAFTIAKYAIQEKNYQEAEKQLKWVLEESIENDFKKLARVRLIKTYYASGQYEKALALYNQSEADGWLTLMEELKGDVLKKQAKLDEAITSYEAAVEAAPQQNLHGQLLTYKLKELGVSQDKIDELTEKHESKK